MNQPTDEQMDERFVIEGDPEDVIRQFLSVAPAADADAGDDEDEG